MMIVAHAWLLQWFRLETFNLWSVSGMFASVGVSLQFPTSCCVDEASRISSQGIVLGRWQAGTHGRKS